MDRRMFAASVLTAAVGLAGAAALPASAAMMTKEQMMEMQQANMERAKTGHLVKCYEHIRRLDANVLRADAGGGDGGSPQQYAEAGGGDGHRTS